MADYGCMVGQANISCVVLSSIFVWSLRVGDRFVNNESTLYVDSHCTWLGDCMVEGRVVS